MPNQTNKVHWGLMNVHLHPLTIGTDTVSGAAVYTYGTPVRIPGSVSLSMAPQGRATPFYADNRQYYVTHSNTGRSGDLTVSRLPEAVRAYALGEEITSNGVQIENANAVPQPFALTYQIEGDKSGTRYLLYYCEMSRPDMGSQTTTDSIDVQTQTVTITAMPREDGSLSAHTTPETSAEVYAAWFSSVFEPPSNDAGSSGEAASGTGSGG